MALQRTDLCFQKLGTNQDLRIVKGRRMGRIWRIRYVMDLLHSTIRSQMKN